MTEYITYRRFKSNAICGSVNIPRGTVLQADGNFLKLGDGRCVCAPFSENARRHFALNDDGRGYERGAFIWAIAYAPRNGQNGQRFTDSEIDILERDWGHWLVPGIDVILFNRAFVVGAVEDLQALARALSIHVRRR